MGDSAACALTSPIYFSIHLLFYSPGLSQPASLEEMSRPPPPQLGLFLPFLLLLCILFLAEAIHQRGTKASAGHKLHRHVKAMLCPKN